MQQSGVLINPELQNLIDLSLINKCSTVDILTQFANFIDKYMGNQVRKNKSKHYQGHSQLFHNQYVINEFYQHLPQLLSLLFPIQDGIFFDNKFIYFIDGWFTDYKQCMLELMIKKQGILQTIWSEVLDLSSRINNIYETQLPTVCLEYYNLTRGTTNKNPSLKFKIEEVLPYHSQLIIKTNDTQILPAFYHNLTTQPEIQRNALQSNIGVYDQIQQKNLKQFASQNFFNYQLKQLVYNDLAPLQLIQIQTNLHVSSLI